MTPNRHRHKIDKLLSKYADEGYFDKGFAEFEDSTCCICLDEIWGTPDGPTPGKKALLTKVKKCGHMFHSDCIRSWLQSSKNILNKDPRCPMCNLSIKEG